MKTVKSHVRFSETAPLVEHGDRVKFEHFDPANSAWFFGGDARGTEGYFPADWFEISESKGSASALRGYDGAELSIASGEFVELEEEYGGWLLVRTHAGTGWIPAACVAR